VNEPLETRRKGHHRVGQQQTDEERTMDEHPGIVPHQFRA
jgi:hypothetical protein